MFRMFYEYDVVMKPIFFIWNIQKMIKQTCEEKDKEGWELVNIIHIQTGLYFTFKRKL